MKAGLHDIERAVCLRFGLTAERLRGRERCRKVARPRQMAMFLARELTGASLPMIGRHFQRDHTTVLWAVRKIAAMQESHPRIVTYLAEIRLLLAGQIPHKQIMGEALRGPQRAA